MNDADQNPPAIVLQKYDNAGAIVSEKLREISVRKHPDPLPEPDAEPAPGRDTPPPAEATAPSGSDAEAPQRDSPASVTHAAGDAIHAERDVHVTEIRIGHSAAVEDLRNLFGNASNQESAEFEVEALLDPPELEAHHEALEEHRLLILVSTRRTGLTTAAKQRCKSFAAEHGLAAGKMQGTSEAELHRELGGIEQPTVLFFDASRNPELSKELPSFIEDHRDALKQRDCHLVVAVEHEARHEFKERFPDSVFNLGRIDPSLVFDYHYQRAQTEFAHIRGSDYFEDTLGTAWPPLARMMAERLNASPADLDLETFQEDLRNRLGDTSEALRDLLEHRLDPQGKTVLLSAAALELLPPSAIALAADHLFRKTRDDDAPTELLNEFGIYQKLELIRQDFNIEGSSFKNPDIGDRVLLHVWDQYPSWREPMAHWLTDLLLGPDYVEWTELTRLPRRLVLLASATGDGSMLTLQAATMLASRSPVMRALAPAVLLGGALDDTIGPSVRSQLYEWSRGPSSQMQIAALAACADKDYVVRFPNNALFRLRRLSRSQSRSIRDAALDAIVDSSAYLHLSDVLFHFHFWLIGSSAGEISMIPQLLDRICRRTENLERLAREPRRLLNDPFGFIAMFWARLLALADPASARLAVRGWLSAAAAIAPADGDRMIDLLVKSAAGDYRSIGQIAQAAKSLALDGSELSERTRDLSRQMLNRVFEIEVPLT